MLKLSNLSVISEVAEWKSIEEPLYLSILIVFDVDNLQGNHTRSTIMILSFQTSSLDPDQTIASAA